MFRGIFFSLSCISRKILIIKYNIYIIYTYCTHFNKSGVCDNPVEIYVLTTELLKVANRITHWYKFHRLVTKHCKILQKVFIVNLLPFILYTIYIEATCRDQEGPIILTSEPHDNIINKNYNNIVLRMTNNKSTKICISTELTTKLNKCEAMSGSGE